MSKTLEYQLTEWLPREELGEVVAQLEKYGDKEGYSYVVRHAEEGVIMKLDVPKNREGDYAVFTTGKRSKENLRSISRRQFVINSRGV